MKSVKIINRNTKQWQIVKYNFPFARLVANLKNQASPTAKQIIHKWISKQGWDNLDFEHLPETETLKMPKMSIPGKKKKKSKIEETISALEKAETPAPKLKKRRR